MKKKYYFMAIVMLIAMVFSTSIPAFAAGGKTSPYGFVWMDEESGSWHAQYYVYSADERSYIIEDSVSLIDDHLYDIDGELIVSNVRTMGDNPNKVDPTVGFDRDGKLYFVLEGGTVGRMNHSTDNTYATAKVSNARAFVLDADDLVSKIGSKKLTSLDFSGTHKRESGECDPGPDTPIVKEGNYVRSYAVNGDPSKIAYDAYLDDKLVISVYCRNSNVWLESHKILLSETCVGAKFVGFSSSYHTILYDLDGTVYAFKYNEYKKALPISLGEELKSYEKDENGFIKSITTSRRTYHLDDLLTEYGYDDDINRIASVKNTSKHSIGYSIFGTEVADLEKSGSYVYWNSSKMTSSYRPTYLGITESGYPVWINGDSELFYFTGDRTKLIARNVTLLRYNSAGFAVEYKQGSRIYEFGF